LRKQFHATKPEFLIFKELKKGIKIGNIFGNYQVKKKIEFKINRFSCMTSFAR
jgi:hypothetical protein